MCGLCIIRLFRLTASASRWQAHEDLEGVVYHPLQARKSTDHLGDNLTGQWWMMMMMKKESEKFQMTKGDVRVLTLQH